jgi:hypothetical protein
LPIEILKQVQNDNCQAFAALAFMLNLFSASTDSPEENSISLKNKGIQIYRQIWV